MGLGRKTTEGKVWGSSCPINCMHSQFGLSPLILISNEVMFVRFPHWFQYVRFPPPFHWRGGEFRSTSRRVEYVQKLLEILLHVEFFSFTLFISLDPWKFVLYFRLKGNTALFCCWNCPIFGQQELFQLVPVFLRHTSIIVGIFEHFLSFSHYQMFPGHLLYLLPQP